MTVKQDQLSLEADEPVKVIYTEGPETISFKFEQKDFTLERGKQSKSMPYRAAKHLLFRSKQFVFKHNIKILELVAAVERKVKGE
jgi:hypothetical protein